VTSGGSIPRYGTSHWSNEYARLLESYFPVRTGIVLEQFKAIDLYPAVDAPVFTPHGGVVAHGESVSVTAAQGVVYLTFDGSDPREAYTGAVASNAVAYAAPFAVTGAGAVKARALDNGVWSALTEAAFSLPLPDYAALRVAEFTAKPNGNDDYAWLDLVNTSSNALDITGVFIADAITWTAPSFLLPPGGHVVLAKKISAFESLHSVPPGTPVYGYGSNLAAKGETLTLVTPQGVPFFSFTYSNEWYPGTFESGRSLVARDLHAEAPLWSTAANWRPSLALNGTPARSDTPRFDAWGTVFGAAGGEVTFSAAGLEAGFVLRWSPDLTTWHDCPAGAVTVEGGTVRVDLEAAGVPGDRCFFKLVNP
jgi:hypothetical protein